MLWSIALVRLLIPNVQKVKNWWQQPSHLEGWLQLLQLLAALLWSSHRICDEGKWDNMRIATATAVHMVNSFQLIIEKKAWFINHWRLIPLPFCVYIINLLHLPSHLFPNNPFVCWIQSAQNYISVFYRQHGAGAFTHMLCNNMLCNNSYKQMVVKNSIVNLNETDGWKGTTAKRKERKWRKAWKFTKFCVDADNHLNFTTTIH